jgi:hypothetical protein
MANMVTLLPIEPLNDAHGMLIVEAFSRLFVNRGGKEDGDGWGYGDGDGWGWGYGGNRYGDKCPEEWRVPP